MASEKKILTIVYNKYVLFVSYTSNKSLFIEKWTDVLKNRETSATASIKANMLGFDA